MQRCHSYMKLPSNQWENHETLCLNHPAAEMSKRRLTNRLADYLLFFENDWQLGAYKHINMHSTVIRRENLLANSPSCNFDMFNMITVRSTAFGSLAFF